jgi:hypothetical protein
LKHITTINYAQNSSIYIPLKLNPYVEYAIWKDPANEEGLKLNGSLQHLVYADDMNLVGENINTTKKNAGCLLLTSQEVGLQVNAKKTKCVLVS